MEKTKFSVVIPTYNSINTLKQTVNSILNQNYPKSQYEIIVVDDGSTDNSLDWLKEMKKKHKNIRYLTQKNAGPAKARNQGVKAAKNKLIAFTDADCLVPKDWFKRYEKALAKEKDVTVVGGYLEAPQKKINESNHALLEFFKNKYIYGQHGKEYIGGFETPGCVTNNAIYKKNVFLKLKGFNENFPTAAGEDADLKKRVAEAGYKLYFIPMKVTHLQKYGFKRFKKQSIDRGLGGTYFDYLEGKKRNKLRPYLIILGSPLLFTWNFIRFTRAIKDIGIKRYFEAIGMKTLETVLISYGRINHPKKHIVEERMRR